MPVSAFAYAAAQALRIVVGLEGRGLRMGYERLTVPPRDCSRDSAVHGTAARCPWSAFSDVDRTQPSVRIKGSASGKIRTHARRCRTRGLLQGPYRVADAFGKAFLPTSESSLNPSTDFDVDNQSESECLLIPCMPMMRSGRARRVSDGLSHNHPL